MRCVNFKLLFPFVTIANTAKRCYNITVMSVPVIIAAVAAVAMILSALLKPYISVGKIKIGLYVAVCAAGAIAELLFGGLSVFAAINGVTAASAVNPLKILALFLSTTLISEYLGDSGFFRLVAEKAFKAGKGGGIRLFSVLYAAVSALTVFTSNDIVVLTFTPIICLFCKKAGVSPVPYLVGEFVAANTWSMALIVGNPTNVYLAQSAGVSFTEYFKVMALPAAAAGLSAFAVLLALFGRTLKKGRAVADAENLAADGTPVRRINAPCMIVSLSALTGCIVALVASDTLGVEMWIVTVSFALALTLFHVIYGIRRGEGLTRAFSGIKKTPWELAPFVLSMFIIVLALAESGLTATLADALIRSNDKDCAAFGFLAAGLSNLLNNIPASVVTEKIIAGGSVYAMYGAVIGTNIGAVITPVGALAGIMWNKILSAYDVKLPFYKFALYGTAVAAVSLTLSVLVLVAML